MRQRIEETTVDRARPKDRTYYVWDTEISGFGLKVTPSGHKSYVLQYRLPGAGRKRSAIRMTLGRHRDPRGAKKAGDLTLKEARKVAANYLLEVRSGGNPAVERRVTESHTVEELAKRFLEEYLPGKKRPPRQSTVDFYDSIFKCHILPKLGRKPVEAVTAADVEKLHTAMSDKPYMANRTLSLLQHAFDQAERWGWRPQHSNPALHIDRYREEKRGDKKEVMLTPKQMAELLAAIDEVEEDKGNPLACAALRVAFWTGWRIGEVLGLRWENLDLAKGFAKLQETKGAKEEYRQLPAEAIEVIKGQERIAGCPYVFPGASGKGHLTTVKRTWIRVRKKAKLHKLPGLGALRTHDLRHNVVSWDVSRGVPLEIAGRNVGHRSRRSTEVYAHFAPDALKRAADERAKAMRSALEKSRESAEAET